MTNAAQNAAANDSSRREIEHIAYLFAQFPFWREQGWLAPSGEAAIRQNYTARQDALREQLSVPLVPPLPPRIESSNYPPVLPPAPASPAPVRAFLQDNALKIVFALATLLTLAALRSLLQWDWADALLVRLMPALPLGLTLLFWNFGQKTRAENRWAGFAFHGMTCALLAFDCLTVNRYWLFGAIPPRPLLALSFGTAAAGAGELLRRRRETPYFHLFQFGLLLTLYAVLQNFRPLATDFWPRPVLLFGGAYLALASFYLAFAIRAKRTAGASAPDGEALLSETGISWLHASALTAAILAAVGSTNTDGTTRDGAILTLTAGGIYGAAAQALNRAAFAYLTGGLAAVGLGFALLTLAAPTWTMAGGLLLCLCAAGWLLSVANAKRGTDFAALAAAWNQVSLTALLLAAAESWLFAAGSWANGRSFLSLSDAAVAGIGGAFFLLFALRERRTEYLYGAAMNGGVSLVLGLNAVSAPASSVHFALSVYGAVCGVLFFYAAQKAKEPNCATAAALAFTFAYGSGIFLVNPTWNANYGLQTLPLWLALFAPSVLFRKNRDSDALLWKPFRQCAALFSALVLLTLMVAEAAGWNRGVTGNSDLITVTFLLYGAMYAALAAVRQTPKTVFAAALTLTCAYGHHLLTLTDMPQRSAAISWPHFAFLFMQAGAFWVSLGWLVQRKSQKPKLAAPLLLTACLVAFTAAWIGFVTVQTPHEGRWTIITLAWGGAVWFGAWMLEAGEICL